MYHSSGQLLLPSLRGGIATAATGFASHFSVFLGPAVRMVEIDVDAYHTYVLLVEQAYLFPRNIFVSSDHPFHFIHFVRPLKLF